MADTDDGVVRSSRELFGDGKAGDVVLRRFLDNRTSDLVRVLGFRETPSPMIHVEIVLSTDRVVVSQALVDEQSCSRVLHRLLEVKNAIDCAVAFVREVAHSGGFHQDDEENDDGVDDIAVDSEDVDGAYP